MLNKEYKILKMIYRNKEIYQSDILKSYPCFLNYSHNISEYFNAIDYQIEEYENLKDKITLQGEKLSITELGKYIEENLPEYVPNSDKIIYSLNRAGLEYMERKQQAFLSFALPYGITTIIAATAVIAQIVSMFKK